MENDISAIPNGNDQRHLDSSNQKLMAEARRHGCDVSGVQFARKLDEENSFRQYRDLFCYPKARTMTHVDESLIDEDEDSVYFCGHSLGLMPRNTYNMINRELDKWASCGVHGHRVGELGWAYCDQPLKADMAKLAGANSVDEIAILNGLSVNLHMLMISFYRPNASRYKIMLEAGAFPSDFGEYVLRTEDICRTIEDEGESIALILLPGVQYYTGQVLDMKAITAAGHAQGCIVGFDLAHAIGNIELKLHEWNVDFAAWCTYKYLNSGAGCIGGIFLHERYATNSYPRLTGWWSHTDETRFKMNNEKDLIPGADGYRISNPSGVQCACLKASLDIYRQISMADFEKVAKKLTSYLELLLHLKYSNSKIVTIITPSDPEERGCQLSLKFPLPVDKLFNELLRRAVACDKREPGVIRISQNPLYNSFEDTYRFVQKLDDSIQNVMKDENCH